MKIPQGMFARIAMVLLWPRTSTEIMFVQIVVGLVKQIP